MLPMSPLTGLEADPWIGAVHNSIKADIDLLIGHRRWGGAVLLMYAAIDAMAYTTLPPDKKDVTGPDFIAWADRYVKFNAHDHPTGIDLYGARCATLHTYGNVSKISREGRGRLIGYVTDDDQPVRTHPSHPDKIMVSIPALRDAIFAGIDAYGDEVSADPERWPMVEKRLLSFIRIIPVSPR